MSSILENESIAAAAPPFLVALAPLALPNHRVTRYQGDMVCAALGEFPATDQSIIRRIYAYLLEWLQELGPLPVGQDKFVSASTMARQPEADSLILAAQQLGAQRDGVSPIVARAMHDIRGGALTAFLGSVQLLALPEGQIRRTPDELDRLFILARDHLKVTRNAIAGLDDAARERDRQVEFHHIRSILAKWRDLIPGIATRGHAVSIDCLFDGNISECCLESAALDRIFYNLIGNASRHAATDTINVHIFPTEDAENPNLRFVVSNAISPAQFDQVNKMCAGDLGRLFRAEVSTTGSGLGLAIVADFVAQAFGLGDAGEAVREGYVGATMTETGFHTWFHWPSVREH